MKKLIFYAIPIILTAAGFYFLFKSCAHSEEAFYINKEAYFSWTQMREINENNLKKEWQESYEFHMFHALRTFNDAKDKCWYLPRVSDRDKARHCFTAVCSALSASSLSGRVIASLSALLINFGLDALDEWDYISEKLHWSQYHFEQCEFYQSLLNN